MTAHKLTQAQVAAQTGISQSEICRILKGAAVSPAQGRALNAAYKMPLHALNPDIWPSTKAKGGKK